MNNLPVVKSRRDIYDDIVPFDELDPCCQREIINERKKKDVNTKLRSVDRSQVRNDQKQSVFSFYGMNTCNCCQNTIDYQALRILKSRLLSNAPELPAEESSESEDEDFDLDPDFDIPLTEEEQIRMHQALKYKEDLEAAKRVGLGVYWEDSLEHLLEFISNPTVALILHIYEPSSEQCALIDYVIENQLCERYLGTRFRRIAISYHLRQHESFARWQKYLETTTATTSEYGVLLCFKNNEVITSHTKLKEFGDGIDIIGTQLRRFLEQAHVLEPNFPHLSLLFPNIPQYQVRNPQIIDNPIGEKEDEGEDSRYCDDPDCIKRYPHEHIGKVNPPSFLQSKQRIGEEVLAPDLLRRY